MSDLVGLSILFASYVCWYIYTHPFPDYATEEEEIDKREGIKNRDDKLRRKLNSNKKVFERRDDHYEILKRIWLNKPLRDT